LHGARDAAGAAGLFLGDVGVHEGVHARELQRGEEPKYERLRDDEPDRCAHADGREQDNEQTEDDGVGNQYGTVAKAPQNGRHRHLQAHGGHGLGHHEEAGLNRRKPEADLVKEWKEEGDSADAQAGEITAADRRAKGSNAKQGQPEERKLGPGRSQSVRVRRAAEITNRPSMARPLSVCSPNTSSTYDSSAMPEPKRMSPMVSSGWEIHDNPGDAARPDTDRAGPSGC